MQAHLFNGYWRDIGTIRAFYEANLALAQSDPPSRQTEVITLGCRLNSYESAVMRDHAKAAGLSDAIIVNTCAVTTEAVRQARQAIRRAAKDRPDAPIEVPVSFLFGKSHLPRQRIVRLRAHGLVRPCVLGLCRLWDSRF